MRDNVAIVPRCHTVMKVLSRYFSRQIWASFIGFGLILGGLAWMVQILLLMKMIVKYGVDIGGFVVLSLYTLPMLIGIIMPFVVFIAVMFVYNKTIENNEVTVMFASGIPPKMVARPAICFAIVVMIVNFALSLWFVPKTQDRFMGAQWELRYGLGHLKLRESAFNNMVNGVVIYVEKVNQKDLLGLVMRDGRNPGDERFITSEQGKLVNTPNGLSIVMGVGGLQMSGRNEVVIGTFDGAQMDLEMNEANESKSFHARRISTTELILASRLLDGYQPSQRSKIVSELANRFLAPLMGLIFVLVAMAAMLKSSALRRRTSFAGLKAAIMMIAVETMFMLLSAGAATMTALYLLAFGQVLLICGLVWYLWK